jgi:hypothetical protein
MEQQVPASVPPQAPEMPPQLTPEQVAELKRIAKERAVQQIMEQRAAAGMPPAPTGNVPMQAPVQQQPEVIYVRRPLTVAEIIIVFVISCGIVTGGQLLWQGATNFLPRLEIRVK